MDRVEVSAKNAEEALKEGLKQLSAALDEVDVKVVSSGGFFTDAKLIISLTDEVRNERARRREKYEKRRRENEGDKERFSFGDGFKSEKAAAEPRPQEQRPADRRQFPPQKQEQTPRPQQNAQPRRDFQKPSPAPQQQKPLTEKTAPSFSRPPQTAEAAFDGNRQENDAREKATMVPESAKAAALKFLKETVLKMGVKTDVEITAVGGELNAEILSDDAALIGYHGETLDAIEYLAEYVANRGADKYVRLSLDCNKYRVKRIETLVRLAERMAAKCVRTGHKVSMEPMNSLSRKVVHDALTGNDKVITRSEGKDPNRRVVIYCKREKGDSKNADDKQGTDSRLSEEPHLDTEL